MATTRRRKVEPESVELANLNLGAAGAESTEEFRTPTEERRDNELEQILTEIGSDCRVKVWQVIDGKSSYAGEMAGDEFSLDSLLETYGGGDKSLVIYQGKLIRDKVRVSLDPSIPPRNPRTARLLAQSPSAPGGDVSGMFATMMAAQMQSMAATQQMMTGMVSAVTTLMAARPDKDPTDMALRIAEVMRPQGGATADATADRFMNMFERGMNVGKAITGGDSDSVMPVVGEGVKALGSLIEGIVAEKKANAAAIARGALPPTTGSTLAPLPAADVTQPIEDSVKVRPWVDAARPNMGVMLSAARFLSPAAAADTINRALTEEQFFDLIDDIEDETAPGFGPRLLAYFPDASEVDPNWIGELVTVILNEYVEHDGGDETAASPAPVTPATPAKDGAT